MSTFIIKSDEGTTAILQTPQAVSYIVGENARGPAGADSPDATTLIKGKVKLAGDLGGTADSPTVPGLVTKAPLASPAFTGNPTAPTPALNDNDTSIATTAFVTTTNNKTRIQRTVGNANSDYPVANYSDIGAAVNAACTAISAVGGGDVIIDSGTWTMPNPGTLIVPKSNVSIRGRGMKTTIIQTSRTDYIIKSLGVTLVENFIISDMTIDCQNLANVSAVQLLYMDNATVERVYFKNCAKWMLKIGNEPSGTTGQTSHDCKVIDCIFDTHSSIYEMLLIYNTDDTLIQNCVFKNNAANSPTLGIWQQTNRTKVIRSRFIDCVKSSIYYGITTRDTMIDECDFINSPGIVGGNVPDNGLMGETYIKRFTINNTRFLGGANTTTSAAVQFGAVDGCYVDSVVVEGYERGFEFGYGNETIISGSTVYADFASKNGTIANVHFKNINPSGLSPAIHNALVFKQGAGSGMAFVNIIVSDDQSVATNINPISFNTSGATYSNIRFVGGSFPVAATGTSIKVNDSCTVDSTVEFLLPSNVFVNPTGGIQGNSIKRLNSMYMRDGLLAISSDTINANTNFQVGDGSVTVRMRYNNIQEIISNDNTQHLYPNFTGKVDAWYKGSVSTPNQRMSLDIDSGKLTANGGFDANNTKITSVANGTVSTDAAAFGQIPTTLPPSGTAGGDLTGSYPNPTLATSGVSAATYGSATQVPVVTFDAKGRATTVTNTSIQIPESQVTSLVTDLAAKVAKSGDIMSGGLDLSSTATTGYRLYNTIDQVTNYEVLRMFWSSNVAVIQTDAAGTGIVRDIQIGNANRQLRIAATSSTTGAYRFAGGSTNTADAVGVMASYTYTASSGIFKALSLTPTINSTGTSGYTVLFINATETTTGSGNKYLIDAQVGGVSKFMVDNTGAVAVSGKVTNVTDPTNPQDGATKNYVDTTVSAATAAVGTPGTYAYPVSLTTDSKGRVTAVTANTATGSGLTVLQTSPTIITPQIVSLRDANGNPYLAVSSTASAVGGFQITNNISGSTVTFANVNTGNSPTIYKGSGTGLMAFRPGTDNTDAIRFQNSAGSAQVLVADTSNSRVIVGNGTVPNSTLQVIGSVSTAINTTAKTAAYTALVSDSTIQCDTTTTAFNLTLPSAVGCAGRNYTIKRINSGANNLTVVTTASQTIDGATSYVLSTQWKYVTVQSDNANWIVIGNN